MKKTQNQITYKLKISKYILSLLNLKIITRYLHIERINLLINNINNTEILDITMSSSTVQ